MKTDGQQRKIKETRIWFFEIINKTYIALDRLIKKKEKTQITNMRIERETVNTEPKDIWKDNKGIVWTTLCQ